ncbi:RNA-directed DNA polymerase from mobile element jockey [Trichonephila inaurata madagascariensis]|uniref:RNA-directed DNA polymerase from mobile element jockey n=1 Tax=Trichonephila inaurata madagascariensis TaxID=2747483 RepID=A0A8X7CLX6_9ARAC|nr:RNA-directed DNA polymerase from mobile element jockey [Trichonephila inaurata madagascariensis]
MQFCIILDNYVQNIDSYDFNTKTGKNQFSFEANQFLEETRARYLSLKKAEAAEISEGVNELAKQWGVPTEELAQFTTVVIKKQKNKLLSPSKEDSLAKKIRTSCENRYEALTVEDPPIDQHGNIIVDDEDVTPSRSSTPIPKVRPPLPITIDGVDQPAKLLKRIQDLTNQKLVGRMKGRSMRVYPETPAAYNRIRKLIEDENLESFTFQFPEEKEYKVVIKGLPTDMPVNDIVEELQGMGIHPKECKVLISRKTGLPMPLFSVILKNPDNKNIYNLKELCYMKIEETHDEKKVWPCAVLSLPPPKVNFWEERTREKEMQEAAKALVNPTIQPAGPPPILTEVTSSSLRPQAPASSPAIEHQVQEPSSSTQGTSSPLKIVTWNADGIRRKITELEDYVSRHDPDIVTLQETFLQPCNSLNISNYTTYRNDRLTNRGGGTAILIKNSIAHHSIDIHTLTLENSAIVIKGKNKVTICCIYRPPRSPDSSFMESA